MWISATTHGPSLSVPRTAVYERSPDRCCNVLAFFIDLIMAKNPQRIDRTDPERPQAPSQLDAKLSDSPSTVATWAARANIAPGRKPWLGLLRDAILCSKVRLRSPRS